MEGKEKLARLILTSEIENYFYEEADLLDQRKYSQWLDLLHEDIHYWVPLLRNVKYGTHEEAEQTSAQGGISWMDEGKTTLTQRVQQIETGLHWAEEPLSRISHLVTNLRISAVEGGWENPVAVNTICRFLIYKNRVETETDFFVGKREDRLVRDEKGWKIIKRKVILDQNVLLAKNMTFFF
jgi:3-phenylpropionate/cinnamic acid dioxygenase small subunit